MNAYKKLFSARKLLELQVDGKFKNFEDAIASSNLTDTECYSGGIYNLICDCENLSKKIYDLIIDECALKLEVDF